MFFKIFCLSILLLFPICLGTNAIAHGGGLDAHGCHIKHSTNEYHCHRQQGKFTQSKIRQPGERGLNYYKETAQDGARFYRPFSSKSDGTCACVLNRVCVGKRGGRYCINGSGNKRYLH
jgi:hypothetical protein